MIKHRVLIILTVALMSVTLTLPVSAEIRLGTGVLFDAFKDDLEKETSTQVTIPVGIRYTRGRRFSVSLESSYSRSADDSTMLSTWTDTVLAVSYVIPGLPLPVMAGINLNLPTGKEQLSEEEEEAIGEEAEVSQMGQGLNAGLSLSMAKKHRNFTFGFNSAYTYKGEYDPSKDISDDDLDPGDLLLLNGMFWWKVSPKFIVGTSLAYTYLWADKVNGSDNFQEGGTLTLGGDILYTQQPVLVRLSLQHGIPQKSKRVLGDSFKTDNESDKGKTFATALNITYTRSRTLSFRARGMIQYTAQSALKELGQPYAGKQIQYSIGPGMTYVLKTSLVCNLGASYLYIEEEPDITLEKKKTTTGVKLNVGLMYTF